MINPYYPEIARVIKVKKVAEGMNLLTLAFQQRKQVQFKYSAGQFVEVGLPGYGEAPFDLCSPVEMKNAFQVTVREVGELTRKLDRLKNGDRVFVRGPFGNGFPGAAKLKKKNLLIVGGGCGMITFRSIILDAAKNKDYKKIQVFYGVKTPGELLYRDEYPLWRKGVELELIIDKPHPKWQGKVGLITTLFDQTKIVENAYALLCGPAVMYKFVLAKLKALNFKDEDIFLSLERRMECGLGVCQHCSPGFSSVYVCKQGPVFAYSQLKEMPEAI